MKSTVAENSFSSYDSEAPSPFPTGISKCHTNFPVLAIAAISKLALSFEFGRSFSGVGETTIVQYWPLNAACRNVSLAGALTWMHCSYEPNQLKLP